MKKPVDSPPVKQPARVVDQSPPKPKTSLKKKTFKSTQVVKRAIQQLEEKNDVKTEEQAEAAQPEPLKSALDRLKKEVGRAEASKSATAEKKCRAFSRKSGRKVRRVQ